MKQLRRGWAFPPLLIALAGGTLSSALPVLAAARAARVQVPRWTLTDFPRHPGEFTPLLDLYSEGCAPDMCRRLIVRHPIEDVYRFYRQRLSPLESNVATIATTQTTMAKAEALTAFDNRYLDAKERLKPGQATPMYLQLLTSTYSMPGIPVELQGHYKAGRAPFRSGEWLARAEFKWANQSPTGALTESSLELVDFLEQGFAGAHVTGITFVVNRQSAEASAPTELGEPSAGELGVPVYPGARFNAANSSSDESGREYVYESGDPPARVVKFYEARLGKRVITVPDVSTLPAGSLAIVLQGTPAEPKEAIAIMPGGTGEPPPATVIIIRKPPK